MDYILCTSLCHWQADLCSNSAFHTGAKMDFISKVWVISVLCSTCFWLFMCSKEWLDRMGVPKMFLSIMLWNICNMIQRKHLGRQGIQMQARNTKQIISLDGSCIVNGEGNHILTTVVSGYCICLKTRQNIFLIHHLNNGRWPYNCLHS